MNILEKILKNRAYLTIVLSISIFFILYFISAGGNIFYSLNKDAQGLIASYFNKTPVSQDIVIVEIDDKSTRNIERFPFDRKKYIPVIERLNEQGVALIAFDIIFADKTNPDSDIAFSESIRQAKNIVLGLSFSSEGFLEQPLDIFKKYVQAIGFYSPYIDPITSAVYSYIPQYIDKKDKKVYDFFAITIAKQYLGIRTPSYKKSGRYYLDNKTSLPFESKNKPLIYINQAGVNNYSKISFYDIYNEDEFERVKKQIDLKNKIVIIGATAKGIKDTFSTSSGIMYGVYLHANALNAILTNSGFQFLSIQLEWIIIFLIIMISIYFNLSRSGKILIFSNIFLVAIFGIFFPLFTYVFADIIINFYYELFFAIIFSLALSNIFKYMIENKHKNKLNQALGEYVSKDIAAEILSGAGKINLDGEEKKIAIFFSDIEGFTSISEKFTPQILVTFLRSYLSEMSNIIMDQRGFINKYEGDAIMGLWGVFESYNDRTVYDACESALQQQEKLKKLNVIWKEEGFNEIKARIGIHTGDAIIGNIGTKGRKMEFTALGDNVNLASRLEGVNKFYGTYLCVSEDVVNETKEYFSYRYLDKIRVKGKENPIVIYELLSRKGCLDEKRKITILQFTQGIKLYLSQDFESALKIFNKCMQEGDIPSKTYYERSKVFLDESPIGEWDGVWNHDEK